MLQNCSKTTPPQHLNIASMNESEAPPSRAGNLSLRDHSDVHNREGTAPAVHPESFLHYLGHTQPVVAQRRACQARPVVQQGHRPPDNTLQLRNLYGLPKRRDHGELSLRHEREVDD